MGEAQAPRGVSASEMTYIVSSGALNSTHSLTHSQRRRKALPATQNANENPRRTQIRKLGEI